MTRDINHNLSSIDLIIEIKLITEDMQEYIYKSRKISDRGAVLEYRQELAPLTLHSIVMLQVCSQLGDEEAHPVKAEVMKISDDGIEFRFIL